MTTPPLLTDLPACAGLRNHAQRLRPVPIETLFDEDPDRSGAFSAEAAGLHLDYSKHLLDRATRATLLALAKEAGLRERIRALLEGEPVNNTENRAALHTLLRAAAGGGLADRFREVAATRERMRMWAGRLTSGDHRG